MGKSNKKANVLTDSGVYQSGNGYERMILINDWHPTDERLMAQLHIRVDKNPGDSFAHGSVWTPYGGWMKLVVIPPNDFWGDMPGYLRWANDNSESKTWQWLEHVTQELAQLARESDVIR